MIDEDLAEYQHKVGLLNVRFAVRHYVSARDREKGKQLYRELQQQCDALARGLGLRAQKPPHGHKENVLPRPDG
jgi:hypothetical protein